MLVNLANSVTIAGGGSQTFQYACNSAQRIYFRCDDDGTDSLDGSVTVQIGNEVIVNDISFTPLTLISCANGGGKLLSTDAMFSIDLGSHILDGEENLYVTVRNRDASNSMVANDISAVVNEGGVYQPLKYTNYSDSVFTDTNTLTVYAWAGSALDDDATAFTIRNQAYSSAPLVQDGVVVTATNAYAGFGGHDWWMQLSTLAQNQVPMNTSINYSSTDVGGVVCISAMDKSPSKASASRSQGQAVLSAMTSQERKAL